MEEQKVRKHLNKIFQKLITAIKESNNWKFVVFLVFN